MAVITILIFSALLLVMMRQNRNISRLDRVINNLKDEISLVREQAKRDPEAEAFRKKCSENSIRGGGLTFLRSAIA